MPGSGDEGRTEPRPSPRNKRAEIVAVATEFFGENGYEDTKWADVATAVGLGPTALYHYFESKQQCLFEILAEAIEDFRVEFLQISGERADFAEALLAVLRAGFDLNDREVRRNRLVVAEHGLARHQRAAPREEEARQRAYAAGKGYEAAWRDFLAAGMEAKAIPAADPQLLARLMVGAYNSAWQWYRPEGRLDLTQVGDFYVPRLLAIAGLPQ